MKAAYLKAPMHFEVRDVELREPGDGEVAVRVMACGLCGHDMILARYAAEDWQPFGHEFSGVVEKLGANVRRLAVGDRVAIETSTFGFTSDYARDGHPELDTCGPSYMNMQHTAMGFAERTVVPAELCVRIGELPFSEACFLEPMGVAMDLILTADIKLGDTVAVMGLGAIGLMALQMAKRSGARHIYAVDRSHNAAKLELAKKFGADTIICSDVTPLESFDFPEGGVDKALVTTPPATIDIAARMARTGGIVAFLGISYGPDAVVSFDSNVVHLRKLQIRASNAIPALYFPRCIELIRTGFMEVAPLLTHPFALCNAPEAIAAFASEKATAVKAVMLAQDCK